jgi:DNA mismatch endonuclease (patch repair protein)
MSLIRHKDTKPELRVRRLFHAAGLRYRLHDKRLPGRPDIVFSSRRIVVFVHGCFWHRHPDRACKLARLPKTRLDFWLPKLDGNARRDARNIEALEADGWRVVVVWECQTRDAAALSPLVREIQGSPILPSRRQDRA